MNASDYRPANAVDALPPATRAAVIDGILKGAKFRDIAKICGLSAATILRYRDKVVLPSLQVQPGKQPMRQATSHETVAVPTSIPLSRHVPALQPIATQDVMRTSPVRDRVQSLWATTHKAVRKASGDDKHFGALPGLLNQAHKNVEMLAKLTGELQDGRGGGGPAVAIQIVYHGAQAPEVAMNETGVIDAPGIKIGIRSQS